MATTADTLMNGNHKESAVINGKGEAGIAMDKKKRKIIIDVNGNEDLPTNGNHHSCNIENGDEGVKLQNNHGKRANYEPIEKCRPVDLNKVLRERHSHVR